MPPVQSPGAGSMRRSPSQIVAIIWKRKAPQRCAGDPRLLADPQAADHLEVLLPIVEPQILKKPRPFRDHHEQPATARMVLPMGLEVVGQVVDPGRQEGNLHLGRPRILLTSTERPDEF